MADEVKQLFTPAEAAKFLSKRAEREISVARLAQLRRAGKVKATIIGYNTTVYTRTDLDNADVSLNPGRTLKKIDTDDDTGFVALARRAAA